MPPINGGSSGLPPSGGDWFFDSQVAIPLELPLLKEPATSRGKHYIEPVREGNPCMEKNNLSKLDATNPAFILEQCLNLIMAIRDLRPVDKRYYTLARTWLDVLKSSLCLKKHLIENNKLILSKDETHIFEYQKLVTDLLLLAETSTDNINRFNVLSHALGHLNLIKTNLER